MKAPDASAQEAARNDAVAAAAEVSGAFAHVDDDAIGFAEADASDEVDAAVDALLDDDAVAGAGSSDAG